MGGLRRPFGLAILAAVAALVIPAWATAATGEMTVPFTQVYVDGCNGDTVTVTGLMHMVYITSDTKDEVQTNWPDTTGMGLSGTLYQANDAKHLFILAVPPGQVTFGFQDSFELVSLDETSNLLIHEAIVVTVDSNFIPIRVRMQGDATCSGPGP